MTTNPLFGKCLELEPPTKSLPDLNQMSYMQPIILCGGSGARLWPLSRATYPKQFLRLNGELSLLQQTIVRLNCLDRLAPPILICNESSRFIAAEQLREIGVHQADILLEPVR